MTTMGTDTMDEVTFEFLNATIGIVPKLDDNIFHWETTIHYINLTGDMKQYIEFLVLFLEQNYKFCGLKSIMFILPDFFEGNCENFVQQLRPYIDWNWERSDNDRFTFCDDLDDKIQNIILFKHIGVMNDSSAAFSHPNGGRVKSSDLHCRNDLLHPVGKCYLLLQDVSELQFSIPYHTVVHIILQLNISPGDVTCISGCDEVFVPIAISSMSNGGKVVVLDGVQRSILFHNLLSRIKSSCDYFRDIDQRKSKKTKHENVQL